MTRRRTAPIPPDTLRAAVRFARLPGVTRAAACERFSITPAALRRALKEAGVDTAPTRADLLLHSLTRGGTCHEGEVGSLAVLASWLDYVDKDGSRPEDVAALLESIAASGRIVLEGGRWRLVGPFP